MTAMQASETRLVVNYGDYMRLAPTGRFSCDQCGRRCSTNCEPGEKPYSICCKAPIWTMPRQQVVYRGEVIHD